MTEDDKNLLLDRVRDMHYTILEDIDAILKKLTNKDSIRRVLIGRSDFQKGFSYLERGITKHNTV